MLHLGNAGQLGLQSLLLLGEREARRRVQLLEAPASLPVELQQVGVVLPAGGEGGLKWESKWEQLVSFSCFTLLDLRRTVNSSLKQVLTLFHKRPSYSQPYF